MTVIGIDLGTTNSCVAVMSGLRPKVITNTDGEYTTPSMVALTDEGDRLIGSIAKRQAVANPKNTIFSVKRLIGRKFDSDEVKEQRQVMPYSIVRSKNGDAWVQLGTRDRSPPEISAFILEYLKKAAEEHLDEKITEAVITVPAHFNDAQRQATKDAGKIAGLNVRRIINEPTAAALAYGIQKAKDQTLAVFDLGGGTFDITILEVAAGAFEVLATAGDNLLGGDDFDSRIVEHLVDEVDRQSGANISRDATALRRLKEVAETAKRELSVRTTTQVNVPFLTEKHKKPVHLKIDSLSRELVESLVSDELDRLREPCKKALQDADLDVGDIDRVLLVGGMTRMPAVQRIVQEVFKKKPNKDVNPDQIVAMGAAVQGSIMTGERKDAVLMDVTPHALGIRVVEGRFSQIIERNTRVPCRQVKTYAPAERGQDFVTLQVYQGESEHVRDNAYLGEFTLGGLPTFDNRDTHIQVTFMIDADGLANVSAIEPTTGKEASVKIRPSGGLSKDEVDNLVGDLK